MVDIEVEVTTEIWRTRDTTLVVMYPFPNVAYIKGLRGKFNKELRLAIKEKFTERGVTLVHYERRKGGKVYEITLER